MDSIQLNRKLAIAMGDQLFQNKLKKERMVLFVGYVSAIVVIKLLFLEILSAMEIPEVVGVQLKTKIAKLKVLIGQGKKYYKLTALEIDEETTALYNRGLYWRCRCDCGNEVSVLGSYLASGGVKSCGCIRSSYGEEYIASLLDKLNLKYKKEYCFQGLYGDKGINLRFDFAILDENEDVHALIEYDGEQHYHAVPHWGGQEGLQHRQENDRKKDLYCKQHGLKLIRIPYYKLSEIDIVTLKEMIQ